MPQQVLALLLLLAAVAFPVGASAQMCVPVPANWTCPAPALEEDECEDPFFGGCVDTACQAAIDAAVGIHSTPEGRAKIAEESGVDGSSIAEACQMECVDEYRVLRDAIQRARALRESFTHVCAAPDQETLNSFDILPPTGDCAAELAGTFHALQVARCALIPPSTPCCDDEIDPIPDVTQRCVLPVDEDGVTTSMGRLRPALAARERALCAVASDAGQQGEDGPKAQMLTLLDCMREPNAESTASCPANAMDMDERVGNGLCEVLGTTRPVVARFTGRFDAQAVLGPMRDGSDLCRFGVNALGTCIDDPSAAELGERGFPATVVYNRIHDDPIRADMGAEGPVVAPTPLDSVTVFAEFFADEDASSARRLYRAHFPLPSGDTPVEAIRVTPAGLLIGPPACAPEAEGRARAQMSQLRRILLAAMPDLPASERTFPITTDPRDPDFPASRKVGSALTRTDCAASADGGALCWMLAIAQDPGLDDLGGERLTVWRPWKLTTAAEVQASDALRAEVLRAMVKPGLGGTGFVAAYRPAGPGAATEAALVTDGEKILVVTADGQTATVGGNDRAWLLKEGFHAPAPSGGAAMQWWLDWYPLTGTHAYAGDRSCWRVERGGKKALYCGQFGRSRPGDPDLVTPLDPSMSELLDVEEPAYRGLFALIANKTYRAARIVVGYDIESGPPALVLKDAAGDTAIVSGIAGETSLAVHCSKAEFGRCRFDGAFLPALVDAHRDGAVRIVVRSRNRDKPPSPVAEADCPGGEHETLLLGYSQDDERWNGEWRSLNGMRLLASEENPEKWSDPSSAADMLTCITAFDDETCIEWALQEDYGTWLTDSAQLRDNRDLLLGGFAGCKR